MLVLYKFCYRKNKIFPFVCLGLISSFVVCAVEMFFFYPHRIVPFSFAYNFIYFLVKECFLPAVVVYGVFFLISKDTIEYKIDGIFPLEISFYMIFCPYTIINSSSGYMEPFSLFLKPIIYVAMFGAVEILAREMYKSIKSKVKIWMAAIYAVIILVYLVGPAAIESLYLMNTKFWLSIILTLCYVAYPVTYEVLNVISKIKDDDVGLV